jgi:hypothetical protein
MNAQPNYFRMKGPGDLPHPNDPQNEVEPAFSRDEAALNVLRDMPDWQRSETVERLADSVDLLAWIERNVSLPVSMVQDFFCLKESATAIRAALNAEYEALNAEPDDAYEPGE